MFYCRDSGLTGRKMIRVKDDEMKAAFSAVYGELNKNKALYLFLLPAVVLLFIFCYIPLFGLLLAFKEFNFDQGIFFSPWAKPFFNNFTFLFGTGYGLRAIKNTVLLNALFIFAGLIFEVGFALIFNEIGSRFFKKITQTLTFLPYFISWIVVGVFTYNILTSDHAAFNNLMASLGLPRVDFLGNPAIWPFILMLVSRWKNTGYGSVIYLAMLSGIDSSYYEAADMDGASKWQQIRYISLPLLRPTIMVMTLLQIGRIFNADFGMFYSVVGDATTLYATTDVIDTFVYRSLRVSSDIGMASAAGFVQSILSFLLVMASNLAARWIDRDSALF